MPFDSPTPSSSRTAVKRFALNEHGRDFAVGDIHGAFSLVDEALQCIGFNPSADRLFCVGDLVDRGSESHLASAFLRRPGVYAVKGNHDDDLVRTARSPFAHIPELLEMDCHAYGQTWWHSLGAALREEIACALEELPTAIEIETREGLVCIVHAEPIPELPWSEFADLLRAGDLEARESALWGRHIAEGRKIGQFNDVWRVFAGHTPAPRGPLKFGNLFCIDTGAVFGALGFDPHAHLTLVRIDMPETHLLSPRATGGLFETKADGSFERQPLNSDA